MLDESVLGYSLNEIKFISRRSLNYEGVYPCHVSKRVLHKRNMRTSSSSRYRLELTSDSKDFKGIIYVNVVEFDRIRQGQKMGNYSIVTSKGSIVRFSKELFEHSAMKDITRTARKIVFQTILVLLFLGIPTLAYLLHFITMFW